MIPRSVVLPEKLRVLQLFKKFLAFKESQISLQHSEKAVTKTYSEVCKVLDVGYL
jgi:hypothetical protein